MQDLILSELAALAKAWVGHYLANYGPQNTSTSDAVTKELPTC